MSSYKNNQAFTEGLKGGDRLYDLFKKRLEKNPPKTKCVRRKPGIGG